MEEINLSTVLQDSYDLLVLGIAQEKDKKGNVKLEKNEKKEGSKEYKYVLKNRTKLKSLMEALRQHHDSGDNILHFIKYSEYFLPRSEFDKTISVLLEKVNCIEKRNTDKKKALIEIKYAVGYTLWTVDALCNIFTECSKSNANKVKEHVKMMIDAEFAIAGVKDEDKKSKIVDAVIKWYDEANKFDKQKKMW